MGARMRELDWSTTPLGPLEGWPQGNIALYPAGSAGPKEADDLLARDGRHWLGLDGKTD